MKRLLLMIFLIGVFIFISGCSKENTAESDPQPIKPSNELTIPSGIPSDIPSEIPSHIPDDRQYNNYDEPEPARIPSDKIKVAKISDSVNKDRRTMAFVAVFPYDCEPELVRIGCPENTSLLNSRDKIDGTYDIAFYKVCGDYRDIRSVTATADDGVHTVAVIRLDFEGAVFDESSMYFIFDDASEYITCKQNTEASGLDIINNVFARIGIINIAGKYYFYRGGSYIDRKDNLRSYEYRMIPFDDKYPSNMDVADHELYLSHFTADIINRPIYEAPYPFIRRDYVLTEVKAESVKSSQEITLTLIVSGDDNVKSDFLYPETGDSNVIPILKIKNPDGTYAGLIADAG